jgi:hypothetical protein
MESEIALNGQSLADTRMDADLTSFLKGPPPCVGFSAVHLANLPDRMSMAIGSHSPNLVRTGGDFTRYHF